MKSVDIPLPFNSIEITPIYAKARLALDLNPRTPVFVLKFTDVHCAITHLNALIDTERRAM